MITDVEVEDYQAIRKASFRLGRFTVVTGPTGSGKSAVIRAIRLVAFNARGTSYIRHGAKSCKAALGFRDELTSVGIERGGRGTDKYRIVNGTRSADEPHVEEFTKLAGAVPQQVQDVLRLTELNIAGQFDRPYLLDAAGSHVARVLGELTNVTIVFDAAREATRRARETGRELKRAEHELDQLTAQAARFRGIRERRAAAAEAGRREANCQALAYKASRLRAWAGMHDRLLTEARLAEGWGAGAVPSAAVLEQSQKALERLRALRDERYEAGRVMTSMDALARRWGTMEDEAHRELHDMLVEAGQCPTCGRQIRE